MYFTNCDSLAVYDDEMLQQVFAFERLIKTLNERLGSVLVCMNIVVTLMGFIHSSIKVGVRP